MSYKLKAYLCSKVLSIAKDIFAANTTHAALVSKISLGQMINGNFVYILNVPRLQSFSVDKTGDLLGADDIIRNVHIEGTRNQAKVIVEISPEKFIKMTLDEELEKMSIESFFTHQLTMKEKVIVEFSSVNIAKPFHVGHLRSTIIGNFISNIYEFLGNDVVRMNYLGDWGTQFGLLQVGLEMLGYTDDQIKQDPIHALYKAYVAANQAAETDVAVGEKARKLFQALEEGRSADVEKWEMFRSCTVKELERMYGRLNVRFDAYEWESSYGASRVRDVLKLLEAGQVMGLDADGRRVAEVKGRQMPLVKSDGTTLYLTRDVVAAVRRHASYGFDRMLYVVDGSQSDHFAALFGVLSQLGLQWSDKLRHIKFGRIRGMSTRKGSVVFLTDILDEARDLMRKKQLESATTKVDLEDIDDATADILGMSAVVINDLKQRRQRDYDFDWNKALQMHGDSGVRLQYAHCRLCSLERNCGVCLPSSCDPGALREPEAVSLVQQLARFDEVVVRSSQELEACVLVNYLFKLCAAINSAFKVLQVKNQDGHTASQRLLLFLAARHTLRRGMKILGLRPLAQM